MKFDSFKRDVFSQNGEDGVLEAILDLIPKQDLRKLVVEFGAWDGINFSNTYNLILNHGFSAILIESNKQRFKELWHVMQLAIFKVVINSLWSCWT